MESTKPASAKVPKGDLKNSVLLAAAPIDFSFKCLSAITTEILEYEYPRDGVKKLKQTKEGKYHSATLKLNNNLLASLKGLDDFVSRVMHQPEALMWLDLSFNYICSIEEIILQFKNLKILYLHGNSIDKLDEIDKLRKLETLRSLTLHGNPIEIETSYKQYVISTLPHISILDFSAIIRSDRVTARCISGFNDFHSSRKPARRKHTKTF